MSSQFVVTTKNCCRQHCCEVPRHTTTITNNNFVGFNIVVLKSNNVCVVINNVCVVIHVIGI